MIVSLEDAGFNVSFSSIYHSFASGFPKAMNISLAIDHRECREQLEKKLGRKPTMEEFEEAWEKFRKNGKLRKGAGNNPQGYKLGSGGLLKKEFIDQPNPSTPAAQALDGSYGGFQPKPAVEVVIVAMKPLSEKTYVDQALANGKGISWLDDCRVPYRNEKDYIYADRNYGTGKAPQPMDWDKPKKKLELNNQGRFPANLLVSDDCLNDGKVRKSGIKTPNTHNKYQSITDQKWGFHEGYHIDYFCGGDSGSFSRYFSLDAWWEKKLKELPAGVRRTFPFLLVAKASKAEKNRGCEGLEAKNSMSNKIGFDETKRNRQLRNCQLKNNHPTVKPLKLMSYLITLGSRQGDIVLDPFIGSGTTAIAAVMTGRHYIGYETNKDYVKIANKRLAGVQLSLI